jgi:hypothetical protein
MIINLDMKLSCGRLVLTCLTQWSNGVPSPCAPSARKGWSASLRLWQYQCYIGGDTTPRQPLWICYNFYWRASLSRFERTHIWRLPGNYAVGSKQDYHDAEI